MQQVKAVGVLCGHGAPVTDLAVCRPIADAGDGYTSSASKFSALISACCDGFLCVWSKSSGHCRCRRKLPPWVGTPRLIRTLPSTPRYVCIACSLEGNEGLNDRETQPKKPPKCTILIVDSYSLSITQTVFHGSLSIGPIKFMALVLGDDEKRNSVFVADSAGRQQMVPISEDRGDSLAGSLGDKGQLETSFCDEGLSDVEQIVSVLTYGNVVASILEDRCVFRLLNHSVIGEVSFVDSLFSLDQGSTQTHAIGGIFLENDDLGNVCDDNEYGNSITVRFVVWNNVGYAVIYNVSYQNDVFQCEPLSEIPGTRYQPDMRLSVFFQQVSQYLVCIKSICFNYEEPLLWRPLATIWSLHDFGDEPGRLYRQCRMICKGVSFTDWFEKSTQLKEVDGLGVSPSSDNVENEHVSTGSSYYAYKGKIVSSSMIISENLFTPYAVVYGFLSGEIELVRFDLFQGICLDDASSNPDEKPACKQFFSGHTGAVLCLAAHQMMGSAKSWTFKQVLVSGSMDCTIRIWDLDTGSLIMVMHHHVAPVRQIILPPSLSVRPWSNCFLSVGEDACVALVSLETLRVERIFPGHMNYPSKVLWDGARGYISCLCQTNYGTSDAADVLYIWDVKTGSRERVLRGTAAHSMFDHFCKSISMNSISGTLLNGNTSVSSLLLPLVDDARFSNSPLNRSDNLLTSSRSSPNISNMTELNSSKTNAGKEISVKPDSSSLIGLLSSKLPIKCACPFPGIVSLCFDLSSLMFLFQKNESMENGGGKPVNINLKQQGVQEQNTSYHNSETLGGHDLVNLFDEYLLRYSLSYLHSWGVDTGLDNLLVSDMKLRRPENFIVGSGLQGDKGSLTLTFPAQSATPEVIFWTVCWDLLLLSLFSIIPETLKTSFQLWNLSSEFCAMRSLTMVSLAQRLISLSHSGSAASRYSDNYIKRKGKNPAQVQLFLLLHFLCF